MNICFVTDGRILAGTGGGRHLITLIRGLVGDHHRVTVLTTAPCPVPLAATVAWKPCSTIDEFCSWVLETLDGLDCDVVHFNNVDLVPPHRPPDQLWTATLHTNAYLDQRRSAPLIETSGRLDAIIAVSERLVTGLGTLLSSRLFHIPNGIDLDRFRPSASTSTDHSLTRIVIPGRDVPGKRLSFGIDVAASLAQLLNRKVEIVTAGANPMPNRLAPTGHVRLVERGWVPYDDMPRLYQESSAILMPSVNESCGLVALEALASEVPVLVSAEAATGEVLTRAGLAPYVCHGRKVTDWVAAAYSLVEGASAFQSLRERGREYVCRNHNAEDMLRRYLDCWTRVCNAQ